MLSRGLACVRSFVRLSINFSCDHRTVRIISRIDFLFGNKLYDHKISDEFDIRENRIQDGRLAAIFVRKNSFFGHFSELKT